MNFSQGAAIQLADAAMAQIFPKEAKLLQSDDEGEYKRVVLKSRTETIAHTPQHNPFAERLNCSILDPARVLLEQAGLSGICWSEAIRHAAYIKNGIWHSALSCTPFENLKGEQASLKYTCVFRCKTFVYIHDLKSKVHARAIPEMFLSCNGDGVYRIEFLTDCRTAEGVQVTFDDICFPRLEKNLSQARETLMVMSFMPKTHIPTPTIHLQTLS